MRDNYGWPGPDQINDDRDKIQHNSPQQRLRLLIVILLVLMVLFAGGFFYLLATRGQPSSSRSATTTSAGSGSSAVSQSTSTSNPVLNPAPSPTPTPSPTATPLPEPGTVLCQPKASDWPQTSDWQTVGMEYVNKDGNSTPVIAPCNISVSDYYVEAQIRSSQSSFDPLMGVLARMNLQNNSGYKGGIYHGTFCGDSCGQAELDDLLNSQSNTAQFGSFYTNTVYTVKLRVKGTDVSLSVNNNLVLEQHYTSANNPGQVGLECAQACEVLQFTVVAQ